MNRLTPNSFRDFPEYIVQNPFREDVAIKSLQSKYKNSLPWLTKSFGRAVSRTAKIQDENGRFIEKRYPAIRTGDGHDEADLLEVDNFASYSFFYSVDPVSTVDYIEALRNVYIVNVRNIFWFNLNYIDPSRGDDFSLELESQIIDAIGLTTFEETQKTNVRGIEILRIYTEPQNIFEGFSFNLVDSQFLHYPNRGLRFDLQITLSDKCQN